MKRSPDAGELDLKKDRKMRSVSLRALPRNWHIHNRSRLQVNVALFRATALGTGDPIMIFAEI